MWAKSGRMAWQLSCLPHASTSHWLSSDEQQLYAMELPHPKGLTRYLTKQTRSKLWQKLTPTSRRGKNEHAIWASTQTMQVLLTVIKGSLKKNHRWDWVWWPMPEIPATGEPEAGLFLYAWPACPAMRPCLKKKTNNKKGQRDYWWTQTHKLLVEKDQNCLIKKKKKETDSCSSC